MNQYKEFMNSYIPLKFIEGSFEKINLRDNTIDKIISTLALHWVGSIDKALKEIKRINKPNGSIDILMIEKNDGKEFKKMVFRVMKKYLSNKQIFYAANLIKRITKKDLVNKFSKYFDLKNNYKLSIKTKKKLIFDALKKELDKFKTKKGIPFDLSLLEIHLFKK